MPRKKSSPNQSVLLSVKQPYEPSDELLATMETFRLMLNDCIRIGLDANRTSLESIQSVAYPELRRYKIASAYKLNAESRACGILRNYRKLIRKRKRPRTPHCTKPMLTTCHGFVLRIEGDQLVLPQKIRIAVNDYVLKKLYGKEIRSVTISSNAVSICYMNELIRKKVYDPIGVVGIDLNYENMTVADTRGNIKRIPMEQVARYKLQCRTTKRRFKRNDFRIRQEIYSKYGELESDKTISEIHKATARIIKHAKKNHLAITIEDHLDKMQANLYQKGNGQGVDFRFKLNSWSRGEAKRQLEYKGKKEGVLVFAVNPRGTSKKCSKCGNKKMIPEENRVLYCPSCGLRIDRDRNASINIRNLGLEKLFSMRFEPSGLSSEAMNGNPMKELTTEVIPRADDSQVSLIPR